MNFFVNSTVCFVHHYRNYFGNVNFFGGPSTVAVKTSAKLRAIEEENQEAMFVILSDVWLDLPKVNLEFYAYMFAVLCFSILTNSRSTGTLNSKNDIFLFFLKVMEKLRVLFNGYAAVPPTLFIFCGNFISEPFGPKHSRLLRGKHAALDSRLHRNLYKT